MNERRIHKIFEISVLLKGAHALIECVGGLVLAFVSTSAIVSLVNTLTQEELIEDPNDFAAAHLLSLVQNFTVWPAPGSEDTELSVLMEREVGHGEAEVYTRVQA